MRFAKPRYIPAILTVALLMGLTAETLSRPRPGDAEPFHARVDSAASQMSIPEGWTCIDLKIPDAAVALLKPNTQICRQYRTSTRQFQFLLIQCRDARDMGGHYPPVCYPASGWVVVGDKKGRPMTWTIGSRTIIGVEYEFTGGQEGQTITRTVDNLLILPRGHDCYVREMKEIRAAAADYLRQFYGAAQIQLIFDGAIPEIERREIFTQLIGKNMNLLTVLERSDEPRNSD
ncbi:MAG TPA: exosortase-associated EpsI family protein [Tepidisphaeraceae bacterium]|jgi:hypothetical protein|nr:exosortase-associated EpsI family protein [Tepidisphaeraceae bacterium]